jgi:hypothetical protein
MTTRVTVDADALNDLLAIAGDHIKMLGQVNRVRASVRALPDEIKSVRGRLSAAIRDRHVETEDSTTI